MNILKNREDGYVALITVLVVSAVGIAIALSLLLLGLGASRTSFAWEQGSQSVSNADACAEVALMNLRLDDAYVGNETISLGNGSCQVLPVLGTGNTDRTVQVEGYMGNTVGRIEVQISQIQPEMIITFWKEVANF